MLTVEEIDSIQSKLIEFRATLSYNDARSIDQAVTGLANARHLVSKPHAHHWAPSGYPIVCTGCAATLPLKA